MQNADFQALLTANTSKTARIRTYTGQWCGSAAFNLPEKVANNIGKIVALLQDKIDEFCTSDQMLLIYNVQPIDIETNYCNLQMVIKPLAKKDEDDKNEGMPIEVIVNSETGEIINDSKHLIDLGALEEKFLESQKLDQPKIYGNYLDYRALTCFVALTSFKPKINLDDLFEGKYNSSEVIQKGQAFNTFIEAFRFLNESSELGKYIVEVACSKEEFLLLKEKNINEYIVKIINYNDIPPITLNLDPKAMSKEHKPEEEIKRLNEAFAEETTFKRKAKEEATQESPQPKKSKLV